MDAWGWIAIYAIGLTLLQLVVYRYVLNGDRDVGYDALSGDGDDRPDGSTTHGEGGGQYRHPRTALSQHAADDDRSAEGRYCPHCGSENESEAAFDRCWNCTRRLA